MLLKHHNFLGVYTMKRARKNRLTNEADNTVSSNDLNSVLPKLSSHYLKEPPQEEPDNPSPEDTISGIAPITTPLDNSWISARINGNSSVVFTDGSGDFEVTCTSCSVQSDGVLNLEICVTDQDLVGRIQHLCISPVLDTYRLNLASIVISGGSSLIRFYGCMPISFNISFDSSDNAIITLEIRYNRYVIEEVQQ